VFRPGTDLSSLKTARNGNLRSSARVVQSSVIIRTAETTDHWGKAMSKETSAVTESAVVHGTVAEGFEAVRAEFEAFVAAEPTDPGAQLAA
jgi:hypothetical protein